jgi:hypothetical protein
MEEKAMLVSYHAFACAQTKILRVFLWVVPTVIMGQWHSSDIGIFQFAKMPRPSNHDEDSNQGKASKPTRQLLSNAGQKLIFTTIPV